MNAYRKKHKGEKIIGPPKIVWHKKGTSMKNSYDLCAVCMKSKPAATRDAEFEKIKQTKAVTASHGFLAFGKFFIRHNHTQKRPRKRAPEAAKAVKKAKIK